MAIAPRPRRRPRASTVATFAAVAAIGLGIVDSMQTRAHNRLSVRPYIVLDFSIHMQGGLSTFAVTMSNEGVGPAIINSMRVDLPASLGGGTYPSWTEAVNVLRAQGATVITYWNFEGGEALGEQRSHQLLRTVMPPDSTSDLLAQIQTMDVHIEYSSIYGEEFSARLR